MTLGEPAADAAARLAAAIDTAHAHLARADTKASILLGFAVVVATATVTRQVPVFAGPLGLVTKLASLTAVLLLGLVVLPRLAGRRSGWLANAHRTPAEVAGYYQRLTHEQHQREQAAQLACLARLAVVKLRLIQAAIEFLGAVLLATVAASLTG